MLTNVFGLLLAVALGGGRHGIEAIIVAFAYLSNATRIMFEFNQIYRSLESSLMKPPFTELLLTQPAVVKPIAEPLQPKASDVRFEHVTFAHAGGPPLFTGLDLAVPRGTTLGLVGRSHDRTGRSAADDGIDYNVRIGGQDISKLRQSDLRSPIAYVGSGSCACFHWTLRETGGRCTPHATDAEEIHQATQGGACASRRRPAGRIRHDGRRAWRESSGGQQQRVALPGDRA